MFSFSFIIFRNDIKPHRWWVGNPIQFWFNNECV